MAKEYGSSSAKAAWISKMMIRWVIFHRPDVVHVIREQAVKKFGIAERQKPSETPDWLKQAK